MYSIALSTTAPAWPRSSGGCSSVIVRISISPLISVSGSVCSLGLQRPHPGIQPVARQQCRVPAALRHAAVAQHDDLVRIHHGGQPVRDHQRGAMPRHCAQRRLDVLLGAAYPARWSPHPGSGCAGPSGWCARSPPAASRRPTVSARARPRACRSPPAATRRSRAPAPVARHARSRPAQRRAGHRRCCSGSCR